MGKRITLFANLDVVPVAHPKQGGKEGEVEEGKQLIFTNFEAGEITMYPMSDKFAKKIGTRLKMSNKALAGELEAEQRRREAQARLGLPGDNGEPPTAETILEGINVKESEKGEEGGEASET